VLARLRRLGVRQKARSVSAPAFKQMNAEFVLENAEAQANCSPKASK